MNRFGLNKIPGEAAANRIMGMLSKSGIRDIQLFYDPDILPFGMWAVVQVTGVNTANIILPKKYNSQKPYLLWWCKNEFDGKYRDPNDEDLDNIIKVVMRAPEIWAAGEARADEFDRLDMEKDKAHRQKLRNKVHEIAPTMQRAIREGRL